MPKPAFVRARNHRGEIQRIPRHWLDNPVLSQGFKVLASQAETDRLAEGPSEDWTLAQLQEHADQIGVDWTGARSKAAVLAAIEATATAQTPDSDQPSDETPDAGDDNQS